MIGIAAVQPAYDHGAHTRLLRNRILLERSEVDSMLQTERSNT